MLALIALSLLTFSYASELSDLPAHGKPFGWGNAIQVEEVEGFLPVKEFFEKYARKNLPVVMRGANKVWPGYVNWQTDSYFKSVAPEKPYMISMDKKRGTPDGMSKYVDFKDFIDLYNTSNRRMVEKTPEFLWPDVKVPRCLDCDAITQGEFLMGNKIWFGFNYTTSVVHKDAADNINCLVYGIKNYTMVSPDQAHLVHLDRPDGLFSTMDVDKVDLEKFPGLEKVQYQLSELRGGDCIFVPYKWIHQVRSYGRNIAVNIWWNYWKNDEFDLETCVDNPKQDKNINLAKFHGWGDFETREQGVIEHFTDLIMMTREDLTPTRFSLLFTLGLNAEDEDISYVDEDIMEALSLAFAIIDTNKDGKINYEELKALPEDKVKELIKHVRYVFYATRVRATEASELDRDFEYEKKTGMKVEREYQEEELPDYLVDDDEAEEQEQEAKSQEEEKSEEETLEHEEL